MKHTDISTIIRDHEALSGQQITVCGWVRNKRVSKNVAFVELNDGTALTSLQLVFDADLDAVAAQNVGAAIAATGELVSTPGAKQACELRVSSMEVLGASSPEYPLQKKRHTLEFLRTINHLRGRTNTFNAAFRVRAELSQAIHDFFHGRGFTYVHTPIMTPSDCEGAGEVFKVTTMELANLAKGEKCSYPEDDFFGSEAYLTVSGQLEGEAMAMALGKIYTFGPTFRAEKSITPRHAAEFWQIEPEVAFADLSDIIELARDMIKFVISRALDKCRPELEFFDKFVENGLIAKLEKVVSSDFKILEYTEAMEILERADVKFEYPVHWGADLQTEHERYLVDEVFGGPVFVTNYPKEIKSFYMKQNDDGKTVAATDLLLPGVGEIIGGSQREDDYDKLLTRMQEKGMNIPAYEWYLDLRKYGSAPHAGFGLGLERLVMYVTGVKNIRDVLPFPRTYGKTL